MNFRTALPLLLFVASSSSSSAKRYEVDNNVRSLKGAAAADADEEHRNLKKGEDKDKVKVEAAATLGAQAQTLQGTGTLASPQLLSSSKPFPVPVPGAGVGQASTFITAFEIFEAAAELAAKLEQACCVSCNQGTSTSNICAGLFELECASPIAQVIGDCLEKLCTCEFRQCALERLVTELREKPELIIPLAISVPGDLGRFLG